MTRYLLSPAARADLDRIWDYTCQHWDEDQAERYLREIQHAVERVAGNPLIGRACDEVRPGYRKHGIGSHIVYYRIADGSRAQTVIVIRVLHRRMDVDLHVD